MIEFLVEVFGEFALQVVIELLIEAGFRPLVEPFRAKPTPWLAAIGYCVFGVAVGGLSLLFFPEHFVTNRSFRLVNLLLTPVAAGICMMAVGAWRISRDQTILRIDRFSYGFLFATGMALVRYLFAE